MKICVLQPDYSTTEVDYKNYDPPRDLTALLPGHEVHHVFLNKLHTYRQLQELSLRQYDVFVNLCEGYLDWSVPSVDVIYTLDLLNLPYTGPTVKLYDPPKTLMKYVAYCAGVAVPDYEELFPEDDSRSKTSRLRFPLFVKPAKAGDSLGIDEKARVADEDALAQQCIHLFEQGYSSVLAEEYIEGREFTVLVAACPGRPGSCVSFQPVEYVFPEGHAYKTYALKTSELHTDVNRAVTDTQLADELRKAAEGIFNTFNGVGYARLDFRRNAAGKLFFLEINFTCSVFYEQGYEGSADYILLADPAGKAGFLNHIIEEGIARHKRRQKKYRMEGNAIFGYGIKAVTNLNAGEIVFHQEESPHRIVTKKFVEAHWTAAEKNLFRHYAYPLSDEVYILWDQDAENWAPQNHSCDPNTGYEGLNLKALRDIQAGEELTLDYACLLDEVMGSFECHCGSPNCRKVVSGAAGNSVTLREKQR